MDTREFIIAVAISVLLHVLAGLFLHYIPEVGPLEDTNILEVFLGRPEGQWQIADIPEPARKARPDKSKFLGMYDQSVKDETVASGRLASGQPLDEAYGKRGADKDLFAMKSSVPEQNEVSVGEVPKANRAVVPEDFYPDFKYGEHTYINVLRYPDVEYFVRLKRIFKMTWNPVPALRRDMEATSVSRGMVSVVLAVSVDKSGDLSELFVLRSSGLSNYDNEAVRAIRASSPFSSPPEKFTEKDGDLRMSWTFVVYL